MAECVFCKRIERGEYLGIKGTLQVVAFPPLNPVTPGHMLVVPKEHVKDAVEDPWVTAIVARAAAKVASTRGDCNLITSIGPAATQTVYHLHVHVVPRRPHDGLVLPWTGQAALEGHDG